MMIRLGVLSFCLWALSFASVLAQGFRAQSDHFDLMSAYPVDAERLLSDLEILRQAVLTDLELTDDRQEDPLRITLTRDPSLLRAIAPMSLAAGLYQPSAIGPDIVIGPAVLNGGSSPNGEALQLVLRHEVVHHLMDQHYPRRLPVWALEGLAEYYATLEQAPDGQVTFGRRQAGQDSARRRDWIDHAHMDHGRAEDGSLRHMIEHVASYPTRDQGHARLNPSPDHRLYYAQSRVLAQFVLDRPDGLARIHRFVDGWDHGDDSEASFAKSFGFGYEDLSDQLNEIIGQTRSLALPVINPQIERLAFTPAELQNNRLRLLLSHGQITERLLDQIDALQISPPDQTATLVLTLAQGLHAWRLGDWSEADRLADQALALDPENAAARKLRVKTAYGRVTEQESDIALWTQAEAEVLKALALSPRDEELHLFRVAVSLPSGGELPPSALRSLDWLEAQAVHTRKPRLSLMMFSALIYDGRLDYADRVLDTAERWARDRADQRAVERLRIKLIAERSLPR